VKLSSFEEEMMVKEDPIKLEKNKNLEKKQIKENHMMVDGLSIVWERGDRGDGRR